MSDYVKERKNLAFYNHKHLLHAVKSVDYTDLQEKFDTYLNNQDEFYRIHMTLFEEIQLFIRATTEQT